MPGDEGERSGDRPRQREERRPGHRAAMEAHEHLLDRPAIDIEPVRQIAEARRAEDRQSALEREIDDEIAAKEWEQKDESAERYAEGQARERRKRDAAAENPFVAQAIECRAGGEERQQPAGAADEIVARGGVEPNANHAEQDERQHQ